MAAGAAGQATIRTQGHLEPGLVPGHGAEEGVQGAQCLNAHCLEKIFQNFVHLFIICAQYRHFFAHLWLFYPVFDQYCALCSVHILVHIIHK